MILRVIGHDLTSVETLPRMLEIKEREIACELGKLG